MDKNKIEHHLFTESLPPDREDNPPAPMGSIETEDDIKVPVQNVEESLIGIFMQDDDAATYIAQSGLREDHFLKRKCRLLYSIILNIRLSQGTCFDESVKVQTSNGRIPICDMKIGDLVLTEDGEFKAVKHIFKRSYSGDMIKLNLRGSDDIMVTPNHKFYTATPKRLWGGSIDWHKDMVYKTIEAGKLSSDNLLITPVWVCNKNIEYIKTPQWQDKLRGKSKPIPDVVELTEDFLKIVGLYISEGSVDKNKVIFSFNINETVFSNLIVNYFSNWGLHCGVNVNDTDHSTHITVYSARLSEWFKEWMGNGCRNKHIPWELQDINTEKLRIIFNYIIYGDGSLPRRKNSSYYRGVTLGQMSEQLSYQMQNIGNRLGYNSSWHKLLKYNRYVNSFVVSNNNSIYKLYSKWFRFTKIDNICKEKFNGYVYNIEVDEVHKYTVNGCLVHNCNFDFVVDSCERKILTNGQTVLDFIGGVPALTRMISSPIATDIKTTEGYVNLVFKNWQWAKIKESVLKINSLSGADDHRLIDIISDTQSILTNSLQKHGLVSLNVLLPDAYLRYEDRIANPEKYVGLKTGFYWLDKYRAVSKKHTTVLGAKTNVGKTSFASQMAVNFALNGANVLIFTPEMDKEEYTDRIVCANTGTHLDDWKAAQIKESDVKKIGVFQASILSTHPDSIYIDDKGSQTVGYILSSIKRHMLSRPVDVVIVDYMQKLRFYGDNIRREIDDAMDKLSSFAKDNNIAMIILSQLRRTKEALPTKEDLKESGNLEIFADVVILIHRDPLAVNIQESKKAWYKIDKNRIGQNTNPVELIYHQNFLKFTEADTPTLSEDPTKKDVNEQSVMEMVKETDE